jgi:hypothetical protein
VLSPLLVAPRSLALSSLVLIAELEKVARRMVTNPSGALGALGVGRLVKMALWWTRFAKSAAGAIVLSRCVNVAHFYCSGVAANFLHGGRLSERRG